MPINPAIQFETNKVKKIIPPYRKIIEPIKFHYGLSFIHFIGFSDKSYHVIMDNEELFTDIVSNIDEGHFCCKRDVTKRPIKDSNFKDCNFMLWNEYPLTPYERVYWKHGVCVGLNISKVLANGAIEVWSFTAGKDNKEAQDLFVNRQDVLMQFIRYYTSRQRELLSPFNWPGSFIFPKGIHHNIQTSCYERQNRQTEHLIEDIRNKNCIVTKDGKSVKLTPAEWNTLIVLDKVLDIKSASDESDVTDSAIKRNLESISRKTGVYGKVNLIRLFRDNIW